MLLKKLTSKLFSKNKPYSYIHPYSLKNLSILGSPSQLNKTNEKDNEIINIYYNRELYTEHDLNKIDAIRQMSYIQLLNEYKKYTNKPSNKTRNTIIQFLIDQIPRKNIINLNNDILNKQDSSMNSMVADTLHEREISDIMIISRITQKNTPEGVTSTITEIKSTTIKSGRMIEAESTLNSIEDENKKDNNNNDDDMNLDIRYGNLHKILNEKPLYNKIRQHINSEAKDIPNVLRQKPIIYINSDNVGQEGISTKINSNNMLLYNSINDLVYSSISINNTPNDYTSNKEYIRIINNDNKDMKYAENLLKNFILYNELFHRDIRFYNNINKINYMKILMNSRNNQINDIILMEEDYSLITRNKFKDILNQQHQLQTYQQQSSYQKFNKQQFISTSDIRSKKNKIIIYLDTLRFLNNNINYNNSVPYLSKLEKNSLIEFWDVIFQHIERYQLLLYSDADNIEYDLKTMEMILRIMQKLKNENNLNFIDPEQEAQLMQILSIVIINIIKEFDKPISMPILASIINNLTVNKNLILTEQTKENIFSLSQLLLQTYNNEYKNIPYMHLNMQPFELLDIFLALINNVSSIIINQLLPDLYNKLKDCGIRFFEKKYITKIILNVWNQKLKLNNIISEEICENSKFLDNLTLSEINIIMQVFKFSEIQFGKIYIHLYLAFFSLVESHTIILEYENIITISKILDYIIEYHLHDHRRGQLEKRILNIMTLIEKSLDMHNDKTNIYDLLEISSTFIPHLNIPDYLFKKIILNINNLQTGNGNNINANSDNIQCLTRFVARLLDKLQPKYTLNIYLNNSNIELNDKYTSTTIELLYKLIYILRDAYIQNNNINILMLNVLIMTNRQLFEALIPNNKQRIAFLDSIISQIKSSNMYNPKNLYNISSFVNNNAREINPNHLIVICNRLATHLMNRQLKIKERFNELLPWLYNIINSIVSYKNGDLNHTNIKQRESLLKKLKDFISAYVIKQFCENIKYTANEIVYDKNITQIFNANTFNTNFLNLEYLLPILDKCDIEINRIIEKNIILQFPRCSKLWTDELIIKNLLLLDKYHIHLPEIFDYISENLFSLFIFYIDVQNLMINRHILNHKVIIDILNAYSRQAQCIYFRPNIIEGQNIPKKLNFGSNTYKTLGILLYKVMDEFNTTEMINIITILGSEQTNYPQAFIDKFLHVKFTNLTFEKALNIKVSLPSFLSNIHLDNIVFSGLNTNYHKDILNSFNLICREKIWNELILEGIRKEIILKNDINIFKKYLEYMAFYGLDLRNIDFIINNTIENENQLGFDDLLNFLTIAYIFDNNITKQRVLKNYNIINVGNNDQIKEEIEAKPKIQIDEENIGDQDELPLNLSSNYKKFLSKLINKLFRTEFFLLFENQVIDDDGKLHRLTYYSSLIMEIEAKSQSFKILPKNRNNSFQTIDNMLPISSSAVSTSSYLYGSDHDLLPADINPADENLFENTKSFNNEKLLAEYNQIARKYYIYQEYKHKLILDGNYDGNTTLANNSDYSNNWQYKHHLTAKFIELQNTIFNNIKFKEEYANFLIDITMILHQLDLIYKTNYECDKSKILIDIAIYDQKIAFINVESNNVIIEQDPNNMKKIYYIDNLTLMKGKTLEKLGNWNVIYIIYDIWNIENDTKEKKEEDIKNKIDTIQKNQKNKKSKLVKRLNAHQSIQPSNVSIQLGVYTNINMA